MTIHHRPHHQATLLLAAACAGAMSAGVLALSAHAQVAATETGTDAVSHGDSGGGQANEVRIARNSGQMEIAIAYPLLPEAEPGATAGNATIKARVDKLLADFESEYQSFAAETTDMPADGPPWTLDISYGEVYAGPGFWAVPLTVYQFAGGAHGGTQALPLVIARGTGVPIPPAGLFRDGANWLPVLAEACHADLAAREMFEPDDDWLREGTVPTPDNYQALLPRADGLQVSFQQYQVGPYAMGAFDVLVPWSALEGLLAPALFDSVGP